MEEQSINEKGLKEVGILNARYQELAGEFDKLVDFMEGRPHDKGLYFVDAVIEYIEKLEEASMERYENQAKPKASN